MQGYVQSLTLPTSIGIIVLFVLVNLVLYFFGKLGPFTGKILNASIKELKRLKCHWHGDEKWIKGVDCIV